jgi:YlmC/YmxH family sporulation protein
MGEETVREIREICCRVTELRYKDVISVEDGCRLGCVADVEIDTCSARVIALVVEGKGKFFGLFGKCEEYVIYWKDIVIIGEDAILVRFCRPHREPKPPKKAFFENLFQ